MDPEHEPHFDGHGRKESRFDVRFGTPEDLTEEQVERFSELLLQQSAYEFDEGGIPSADYKRAIDNLRYCLRGGIRSLLNRNQLVVGKAGEDTVGIGGFEQFGSFDGRPVYEIKKRAILADYQRDGFHGKITDTLMKYLHKLSPNSPVICFTQDQRVVDHVMHAYRGARVVSLHSHDDPVNALISRKICHATLYEMRTREVKVLWYDPEEQKNAELY